MSTRRDFLGGLAAGAAVAVTPFRASGDLVDALPGYEPFPIDMHAPPVDNRFVAEGSTHFAQAVVYPPAMQRFVDGLADAMKTKMWPLTAMVGDAYAFDLRCGVAEYARRSKYVVTSTSTADREPKQGNHMGCLFGVDVYIDEHMDSDGLTFESAS